MDPKKRVLFLCTGNSARSQIAEAIVNHELGDTWQAFSAGTQPTGSVHPLALRVLEESGIHHTGASKGVDRFRQEPFDLVVTVCDDAAENCPVWLGKGKKAHISFPDPAKVEGGEAEKLDAFRRTREGIRGKVLEYLREYPQDLPG